jgi:hypothetical protein
MLHPHTQLVIAGGLQEKVASKLGYSR